MSSHRRRLSVAVIPVGPRRSELAGQDFAIGVVGELVAGDAPVSQAEKKDWLTCLPWHVGFDPGSLALHWVEAGDRVSPAVVISPDATTRHPKWTDPQTTLIDAADGWVASAIENQKRASGASEQEEPPRVSLQQLAGLIGTLWSLPGDLPRRLQILTWFRVAGEARPAGSRFFVAPRRSGAPDPAWTIKPDEDGTTVAVAELLPLADETVIDLRVKVLEVRAATGGLRFWPVDFLPSGKALDELDLGPRFDNGWLHCETSDPVELALHRLLVAAIDRFREVRRSGVSEAAAADREVGVDDGWATKRKVWSSLQRRLKQPPLPFHQVIMGTTRRDLREAVFAALVEVFGDSLDPTKPITAEDLDGLLDEVYGRLGDGATPPGEKEAKTPTPLSVRFGGLEDEPTWERLQGVVVLMRDDEERDWHCLNAARTQLPVRTPLTFESPFGDTASGQQPLTLVPSRVVEREGIAVPVESYLNRSLVFSDSLSRDIGGSYDTERMPTGLLRYSRPGIDKPFFRLPRMIYGRSYRFAAFMVDHGGGLPDALTGAGPNPQSERRSWALDASTLEAPIAVPGDVVTKEPVEFLRRVPLGAPTVLPAYESWPVLPTGVELLLDARSSPEDGAVAGRFWLPLDRQTFDVALRAPACARDVFECWASSREVVDAALRWYRSRLQSAHLSERDPIEFDDPATSALWVSVDRWEWLDDRGLFAGTWREVAAGRLDFDEPWRVGSVRQKALSVVRLTDKRAHPGDPPKVALDATSWTLSVTVGADESQLFRVRVHARSDEAKRFDGKVFHADGDVLLSAESAFLVECPGAALPDAKKLWDGFTAKPEADAVALTLAAVGHPSGFRNVRRWSVTSQTWRWQGLPRDLLQKDDAPWIEGTLAEGEEHWAWEVAMFGARGLSSAQQHPVSWSPLTAKAGEVFALRVPWATPKAELRRFGLVGFGRYAGFGVSAPSVVAVREGASEASWRVALRGPRVSIDKPVIRAAIPMTHGAGAVGAFFVALRGAAFGAAGFTEGIKVRFAEGLSEGASLGRDPTVVSEPAVPPDLRDASFAVAGPTGYTFDPEGTEDPGFVVNAWTVHLPAEVQPWDFVWIQVQRSAVEGRSSPSMDSEWSEPIALQALPNSSDVPAWEARERGWCLSDWRSLGEGASTLVLVVTRVGSDIYGRAAESFDRFIVGEFVEGGWSFGGFDPTAEGFVARVAEVHLSNRQRKTPFGAEELWNVLLPSGEEEARGRIVRIGEIERARDPLGAATERQEET